jgi:hypothetical protein
MGSAAGAIMILGDLAQLEPVAFGLVKALIDGLKGKSDAEVLAGDAADWAMIVQQAHTQAHGA